MKGPTVIVLASGRGERFMASGGTCHKLQAELAGKTVLQHTLAAVAQSGLPWHLENSGRAGMGDSIATAVAATAASDGWLILPADLPLIQSATLKAVASALQQHSVVLPLYHGQRGHPVGFAATCRAALLALQGDQGAASVVRGQPSFELIVDDLGCVTDIDTLADLQRAQGLLRAAAEPGRSD